MYKAMLIFRSLLWILFFCWVIPIATGVDFSKRRLTEVPQHISTKETILDLSGNQLVILHQDDFSTLVFLEELRLNENEISLIEPGTFTNLTKLDVLRLQINKLNQIPDFTGLISLTSLNLRKNKKLEFINTTSFAPLINLKSLSLSSTLPNMILPFPLLPKLKKMVLNDNQFDRIHSNLLASCYALRELLLSNNRLSQLPALTGIQGKIHNLNLDSNYFYHFPNFTSYTNLKELSLKNNFITVVPEKAYISIGAGLVLLDGNPIICVKESCWMKSYAQPLNFNCQDDMPWGRVTAEVACQGMCRAPLGLCVLHT